MARFGKTGGFLLGVSALALTLTCAAPGTVRANELFGDMGGGPYNWSGLYVGGQAGYVWADTAYIVNSNGFNSDMSGDGFLGGGHIGYNWQNGDAVFGIVGDVNFADSNGSNVAFASPTSFDMDMTASMRGKFGITFTDRVLVYVTAGMAIAEVDHKATSAAAAVATQSFSKTHLGFTVGSGVELAVTDWISAFAEYRYTQYGDESFSGAGGFFPHDFEIETHQVQAGISFHFNSWMGGGY